MSCRMWNELIVGIVLLITAITMSTWQWVVVLVAGIYLIVHGLWCRKCDMHLHADIAPSKSSKKKRR